MKVRFLLANYCYWIYKICIVGLIMFRGALIDVEKLLAQLERSEKARLATEARMIDLKSENSKLSEKNSKCNHLIKNLNSDLKDNKEKLKNTDDSLHRITVSAGFLNVFHKCIYTNYFRLVRNYSKRLSWKSVTRSTRFLTARFPRKT